MGTMSSNRPGFHSHRIGPVSPRIESTGAWCSVEVLVVSAITHSKAGKDVSCRVLGRPMWAVCKRRKKKAPMVAIAGSYEEPAS